VCLLKIEQNCVESAASLLLVMSGNRVYDPLMLLNAVEEMSRIGVHLPYVEREQGCNSKVQRSFKKTVARELPQQTVELEVVNMKAGAISSFGSCPHRAQGYAKLGNPVCIEVTCTTLRGCGLEIPSKFVDLAGILCCERRYVNALIGDSGYEAFSLDFIQCFPNACDPYTQLLCDLQFNDALARLELAVHDRSPQDLRDPIFRRYRPYSFDTGV
jgi:hypothetical protein